MAHFWCRRRSLSWHGSGMPCQKPGTLALTGQQICDQLSDLLLHSMRTSWRTLHYVLDCHIHFETARPDV
jgi:hypothetical protein